MTIRELEAMAKRSGLEVGYKRDVRERFEMMEQQMDDLRYLIREAPNRAARQTRILKGAGITLGHQEAGTRIKGPDGQEVFVPDREPIPPVDGGLIGGGTR